MFPELLADRIGGLINLTETQLALLAGHFRLLERWNQTLNLTSRVSTEKMVERHYAESIFLGSHLPIGALRIVDIGSGGGFPGVPIGIVRPECSVTLVESHHRKSVFLREATRDIKNLRVVPQRLDEVRGEFDWAVSRAVKFEDIEADTRRIASYAGLLMGEGKPPEKCFTWNNPIRLPWGEKRILWLGKRST